jgi:hypothetical protein
MFKTEELIICVLIDTGIAGHALALEGALRLIDQAS